MEKFEAWAKLITALATMLWPVLVASIVYLMRKKVWLLIESGAALAFDFAGTKIAITPTKATRLPADNDSPSESIGPTRDEGFLYVPESAPIPVDYLFLSHISFLREDRQDEFKARTGVDLPHYDVRVVLDSYYSGALARVSHVEYVLHESYPEPIQVRSQAKNKFLLKELANGEYVLLAKVQLKDRKVPLVLQRYLNLTATGPRL
jgi:hypothetical protein